METTNTSEQSLLRVVYKYTPVPGGPLRIPVSGANPIIRHVAADGDDIRVWIEHDTEGESWLALSFVPTGVDFQPARPFLSTVVMYGGALVLHLYGEVQEADRG